MAIDLVVPNLGASISYATVERWLKRPGDEVVADEPLVELSTDKATLEVPAPATGRLEGILAEPGEEVPVGAVLARIGEGGRIANPVFGADAGPSSRIDIVKFFENEDKRHADLFAAAQMRAAEVRAALPRLAAEVAEAKAALDDKVALKHRAEQEGLDATKLEGPIAELQERWETAVRRHAQGEAEVAAVRPGARRTFEREIELARSVRDIFGVWEAVEINDICDCYPYIVVQTASEDAAGQLTAIDVGFARAPLLRVRVRHMYPRVSSKFRPKELEWIPQPHRRNRNEADTAVAFIDRDNGTLVLSTLHPVGRDALYDDDDGHCYHRELRNAQLAVSLEQHLHEKLGALGTLDLDRTYPDTTPAAQQLTLRPHSGHALP